MSHQRTRRTKNELLFELRLLWPTDNPANIARRLNYTCLENLYRTLGRWPEGQLWIARLKQDDTLQRGGLARFDPFDEAS